MQDTLYSIRETTGTARTTTYASQTIRWIIITLKSGSPNGFIETFSFDRGGLNLVYASKIGDVRPASYRNKFGAKLPKLSIEERPNSKITISDIAYFDHSQFSNKKPMTMFRNIG